MFLGSIPQRIAEELSEIKGEKIMVLGSGNYRSEIVLSRYNDSIISTDVSVYSTILGRFFSDGDFKKKILNDYDFINDFDGAEYVAAVIQMLEMCQLRDIESDQRKKRVMLETLGDVVREKGAKIQEIKNGLKIESFVRECMTSVFNKAEYDDRLLVAFPPTYTKGYEKMFGAFSVNIEDEPPAYREINEAVYQEFCEDIIKRGRYVLYTDRKLPVSEPVIKYSEYKKKDVFIYSDYLNRSKFIFIGKGDNFIAEKYERATVDDIKEHGCAVVPISAKVENYFRSVYIKKAVPSTPQNCVPLMVISGKKILGFIVYSTGSGSMSYLWADYTVSEAPRASKLIIRIVRCRETVKLFDQKYVTWTERIRTTVFTDKPVSMKYRGIFDLMERKEGKLIYEADIKDTSIEKEVNDWLGSLKGK